MFSKAFLIKEVIKLKTITSIFKFESRTLMSSSPAQKKMKESKTIGTHDGIIFFAANPNPSKQFSLTLTI
jgi:hypothetical protein